MDSRNDLRLVLRAVHDGVLSPLLLAEVGAAWDPDRDPSFLAYLVGRGLLSRDQLHLLESSVKSTGQPDRGAETFASPPEAATGTPAEERQSTATMDPNAQPAAHAVPPHLPPDRYGTPKPFRRGGLGQVWTVLDKTVGREVALKSLRSDLKSQTVNYARFTREARITGQLEHPGVVPLYDVLRDGPRLAYTMRFIDGRTLAEATAEYHAKRKAHAATALDLAALVDAFQHVCRAVAFAHSRGILHRDLKGQNVVLGDFGEVFLLDWGLGKHVDERDPLAEPETADFHTGDTDEETGTGVIVGTPGFMAPEVAGGDPATKASDVYGLGAILYTILAGEPPFKKGTPREIMKRVQAEDPKPPHDLNPTAPPALEAVAAKAMARFADNRYAGAEALALDVRRWLADEPVGAYRDPLSVRAVRWAKRHRTGVVAASVLTLTALAALSVGSVFLWREEERTREQKLVAERNFDLAFKASNGGFEVVEYAEPYLASKQEHMKARKDALLSGSAAFREFLAQKPADDALRLRAAMLFRMTANVHRFDGEFAKADALYAEALSLLEKSGDDDENKGRQAQVLRDFAQSLTFRGKLKEALALADRSKALADGLRKADPEQPGRQRLVALTELDRAGILSAMGNYPLAAAAAEQAVKLFEPLTKLRFGPGIDPYDSLTYGAAMMRLASVLRKAGAPDAALEWVVGAERPLQYYMGNFKQLDPNKMSAGSGDGVDTRWFDGVNTVDVRHLMARAKLEVAKTVDQVDSARDVGRMLAPPIEQWENFTLKYPKSLTYRGHLTDALVTRGTWLAYRATAAKTGDPLVQRLYAKAARADFQRAVAVATATLAAAPDVASEWAELGRAWAGLAALDNDPAARLKAAAAKTRAAELAPDRMEE